MPMRKILTVTLAIASISSAIASTSEPNDTTRVLGEVVVIEKSAKAPIPLLPLDVRAVSYTHLTLPTNSRV